jgi:hypothetical protein
MQFFSLSCYSSSAHSPNTHFRTLFSNTTHVPSDAGKLASQLYGRRSVKLQADSKNSQASRKVKMSEFETRKVHAISHTQTRSTSYYCMLCTVILRTVKMILAWSGCNVFPPKHHWRHIRNKVSNILNSQTYGGLRPLVWKLLF